MCGFFFTRFYHLDGWLTWAILCVCVCDEIWTNEIYTLSIKAMFCSFELDDYESMSMPATMAMVTMVKLKFPLFSREYVCVQYVQYIIPFRPHLKWCGKFPFKICIIGNGREKLLHYLYMLFITKCQIFDLVISLVFASVFFSFRLSCLSFYHCCCFYCPFKTISSDNFFLYNKRKKNIRINQERKRHKKNQ